MSDDGTDSAEKQHDVSQHGPVLHIADVQRLGFFLTQVGSARHLPRTGNTRLHQHTSGIRLVVLCHFLGQRRARAHHAHVALEHVQELRELVDGVLADELPDLGDARIVLHLEHGACDLVLLLELGEALVGVLVHGAKLPHTKSG